MVKPTRSTASSAVDEKLPPLQTVRRTALSLAVAAALPGAMMLPGAALAQEDAAEEEEVIEEIITTGFRGSLRNSMMMKQSSDSIIEAVSAEDIGKLPDASIAEALARLPGLTVQRLNGRGQSLSIRGLGPDFTTALLNGREQVSTGDNRGVEFDQYPSELLSSVVVYKTPDASLIGAGLAGTADMRTIRPLEHGRRTLSANLRYEWTELGALNAGSADDGERATVSYVDQFMDDTLGIALGISHMSNPGQEERYNAWGFPDTYQDAFTGLTTGDAQSEDPNNPGTFVDNEFLGATIGGAKPYVRSSELERTGYMGVIEFIPTDTVSMAFDVYYSTFNEEQLLRGIELPLHWGGVAASNPVSQDDVLVSGTWEGVKGVVRNDALDRDSELLSAGFNIDFNITDDWIGTVDLSISEVDRYDIDIETYSGTGPSGCAEPDCDLDELGFQLTSSGAIFSPTTDYTNLVLTSPQGWGGNQVPGGQVGYNKNFGIEDDLQQLALAVERELDGAINNVEIGANFATREKTKDVVEYFLGLQGGALEAPIPDPLGITDLSFLGFTGGMISYDPIAAFNSGIYTFNPNVDDDVVTKSWFVEEDVNTLYVQFGLDTELGGFPLQGNFGFQYMDVDQSSSAFAAPDNDDQQAELGNVLFSGGTSWSEFLPSVNLTLDVGNDNYFRLALARTVARARMDEMRASFDWSFNESQVDGTTPADGPWGGGGGNPELEPWVANAFDLSYEKYFADGAGYISVAFFYKDLEQFIVTIPQLRDFSGFPVPTDPDTGNPYVPGTNLGFVSIPSNGEGGDISGIEFAFSLSGEMIHESIRDFGIVGNYSNTSSSIKPIPDGPEIDIPGLSDDVFNATIYYENESFSARVSSRYRSEFLGEVGGFGGGRFFSDIASENLIDAQLSYTFSGQLEGLTLLLQGFNLTDEPLITNFGDDRLIKDYQRYGSSYMIGASYTFE
ncbi:MAG: TonB-dependent receptor [Woeseiaceae bacterium]|nr:TonB-dependent receptor [Woeseiaceae bacterium]